MYITIRLATLDDIRWVNQKYDEVKFPHSCFDKETIAIAEYLSESVGLGRLINLDNNSLELGGIYVFESYRNRGIASSLINFLLSLVKPNQTIFCLPLAHLKEYYQKFGFTDCQEISKVPKSLLEKHVWCDKHFQVSQTIMELTHRN